MADSEFDGLRGDKALRTLDSHISYLTSNF